MKPSVIIVSVLTLFIAACSSGDKQARLEKLKGQQEKISAEIAQLEKEIGKDAISTKEVKFKDVSVTEVSTGAFKHFIEIQGRVDAEQNLALSAKSMGVVTKINVEVGDEVRKGQILAELDNQVIQQGIAEVESQLQFANNLYMKQKNLWDQKIGTEVQFLSAKNNKESLEKKLATLNEQMDMSRIKSPIDGTVDEVSLKLGQNAAPGMPAIRVVNFSNLKVKADVAEGYGSKIKKGNLVRISFPDIDKEIESKITYAGKVINPLTRSFTVEAALPPNTNDYKPNMIAILKIADYEAESAVVIPLNVVQNTEEGSYVYVAEKKGSNMVATRQTVEVGSNYNNNVEIKSGLKPGDKIITTGYQDLNEGEIVKF